MRVLRLFSALVLCLFMLGTAAVSQEFRATITGEVTDPSGAPIVGARVVATSVERRLEYQARTNETGRYVTQFLPPGEYVVTVELEGFKKVTRPGLQVSAADRLRVDVRLELGAITESITVAGQAQLLQTETASRSATIEQKLVRDLPANGRNLYQLLYTLPGVVKTSSYWGSFELYAFGNINAVSINGGRSGENETLLDGVATTRSSRSATFAPALNAIEEVNVLTNSYDAQFGRIGGGVTSISLRTGTNTLHGQLFEFLKNDKIGANGYSRNAAGVKRPPFRNNTFGFTVDGPVYIPKLLDGRNRVFFMLSLEALRERNPQTQLWSVPTAPQRSGDFSQTVDNANRQITIYDPMSTTRNAAGAFVRTPFAGNRIPQNRINQVASRAASFYPAPNRPSENLDQQNNYLFVNSSRNGYDQWLGKMDVHITQNSRISWRYGQTPWSNWARIQWGTNAAEPSSEHPSTRVSRNWGADWTYTISPSAVFNLRGGLARYEGFSGNTFGRNYDPRQLGFPDALVRQFTALQFPRFNLTGHNYSPLGATQTSGYETSDTYSAQPNLNVIRGRHSIKTGLELRLYQTNNIRPASASGNYSFGRNWSQADPLRADALSGNEFATFLLGHPTSGFVDRNMDPAYRNPYYAIFVQDDWKVTPRITLNLGLRWDFESPIRERYNRQVRGFAFGQPSPLASQVQGLNLRGGLLFAGTSGVERLAFDRDLNNWQPRAGIAWQFADKWVLRAGYGLNYLGQNANGPDTGFSRRSDLVDSTDGRLTPAVSLSDPFPTQLFPTGLLLPIGSSQGLATNLGLAVSAQYLERALPSTHQFSFGFQRSLPGGWLADASYVGNITRKLPVGVGLNFIPADTLNSIPVADRSAYFTAAQPNPMRGLLPGSAFNGATIPRQQLLVAYPHFSQVNISNVAVGSQRYDSLQMKATRRFSGGLAMQLSYTLAKTLEEVSLLNAQDVVLSDLNQTGLERRLSEWDIPHTFSIASSYELPFGKGKPWLSDANRVVNGFIGGWNLSAQWMIRSGAPFAFPNAGPLAARSAQLTSKQRDENARKGGGVKFDPFFDKWFDTTLFPNRAPAPFTLRDFPTRFPDVRSDFLQSWEISAYKEFPIAERLRWQIRLDAHNAFDYTHFGRLISTSVTDPRFGQLNPAQRNQPRDFVAVMKLIF